MAKQKSDLSRAFSEDGAIKTHVGGQALIEGVMMRGKYNWAVAVREPSGAIYVEEHDLKSGQDKNGWMYWPLVRGCRAHVESRLPPCTPSATRRASRKPPPRLRPRPWTTRRR